ncbi:MAG: response regulator, partial [Nitrospinota bacterium]
GGRLVRDAGRELRRSLTSIFGFSEALTADDPGKAGAREEYLEIIRRKKRQLENELERLSGVASASAPSAEGPPEVSARAPAPRTLLVIDDDADYLRLVEVILGDRHRILTVSDAEAGIARAREVRPDLILLDLFLPQMNGLEVVRALRENPETRDIPILAVSAEMSERNANRALKAGCVSCLSKPFDFDALREDVERALSAARG